MIFLAVYTLISPPSTVTTDYYTAAQNWLYGRNLYDGSGWHFIYFPQSALFYASFAWLPYKASGVVWCIILVVCTVVGFAMVSMLSDFKTRWVFFVLTVVSLFIASGAFKQGQMSVLVIALATMALSCLRCQKWWWAALLLVLNVALKPTSLVFYALFAVMYPQLIWRLALLSLVALLVPFLFGQHAYVWQQYVDCVKTFKVMLHNTSTAKGPQFFGLLGSVFHLYPGALVNYVLRFVVIIGILFLSIYSRLKLPKNLQLMSILSLAALFLVLFSPRVENNDYIILVPSLVYFLFYSWQQGGRVTFYILLLCVIAMCINYSLAHHLHFNTDVIRPAGSIIFVIILIKSIFKHKRDHNAALS